MFKTNPLTTTCSSGFPEMGCGQRISGKPGIRHAVFPVDRRVSGASAPTGSLFRGDVLPMLQVPWFRKGSSV